jgi:DNA adenine methylase
MKAKTVVKWAGGKTQIMTSLIENFPKQFNNYHELFLGGASVFLEMYNKGVLSNKKVFLNDINNCLVNLYKNIRNNHEALSLELEKECYSNSREFYYSNRERFNQIKFVSTDDVSIEISALFLYLNKTCFNGLYRENNKGFFNVPVGKTKNPPKIFDMESFQEFGKSLETVVLTSKNCFDICLDIFKNGDFVYLDPPYHNTFTGYTSNPFGEEEQIKLRDIFLKLHYLGCKVALSNSNNDFIRQIYSEIPGAIFIEIEVKRMINSNSENRKKIGTELLIVNYSQAQNITW